MQLHCWNESGQRGLVLGASARGCSPWPHCSQGTQHLCVVLPVLRAGQHTAPTVTTQCQESLQPTWTGREQRPSASTPLSQAGGAEVFPWPGRAGVGPSRVCAPS